MANSAGATRFCVTNPTSTKSTITLILASSVRLEVVVNWHRSTKAVTLVLKFIALGTHGVKPAQAVWQVLDQFQPVQ